MFFFPTVQRFQDWNSTGTRLRFGTNPPLQEMTVSLPLRWLSSRVTYSETKWLQQSIHAVKLQSKQSIWLTRSCFFLLPAANDILKDSEPGSFIIRDSQSFPGAFGLAVKVAVPPAHVLQGLQGDLSKLNISLNSLFFSISITLPLFPLIVCLSGPYLIWTSLGHLILTSLGPINVYLDGVLIHVAQLAP